LTERVRAVDIVCLAGGENNDWVFGRPYRYVVDYSKVNKAGDVWDEPTPTFIHYVHILRVPLMTCEPYLREGASVVDRVPLCKINDAVSFVSVEVRAQGLRNFVMREML